MTPLGMLISKLTMINLLKKIMTRRQCCVHDLSRGILDNYTTNIKALSVKLYSHFPACVTPQNSGSVPPYTAGNIRNDRAEEIKLPLERLESLLKSKNT